MRRAVLLIWSVSLLPLGCGQGATEPAPPPAVVVAAPAPVAPEPTPAPAPEPPAADCLSDIVALRLLVAELHGQVAAAQDETRRHREGLERAVAELNRLRGVVAATPAAPAPQPYTSRAAPGRVSIYSPPQVQVVGESLLVTGRLYNSGDADASGSLTIELIHDGRTVDTAYQNLMVPARNAMSFAHTFQRWPQNQGTYSARVTPNY